jgi:hypothetical protein
MGCAIAETVDEESDHALRAQAPFTGKPVKGADLIVWRADSPKISPIGALSDWLVAEGANAPE